MKKVAAIIFLLLATVLILYTIVRLPTMIGALITNTPSSDDTAYAVGYWIGHIGSWLMLFTIIYFLVRYGIKWLKSPRTHQSSTTILDEDFGKE